MPIFSHDRRVLALALAGGAPAVVLALLYLRTATWPAAATIAAGIAVAAIWIAGADTSTACGTF